MKLKNFIKLAAKPYIWCTIYDKRLFGMEVLHNSLKSIPDELLERTLVSWEIREREECSPEIIFYID